MEGIGGFSSPQLNKRSCGYGRSVGLLENLERYTKALYMTYQVVHSSANPKWNFRKWRTASFLFLHQILLPTAQRQHSNPSSAICRKPSYARQGLKPPWKFILSISVSSRRRRRAPRVTSPLKTLGIHLQANSIPPRSWHNASSLIGSGSYSTAGFFPG